MIDSANSIIALKEKDGLAYLLKFNNHPTYSSIKLKFSEKTDALKSIYAEFRADYPEPYHSLMVDYEVWDTKWKANKKFPDLAHYVEKKNDNYTASPSLANYKVFKPENAKINLDMSKW